MDNETKKFIIHFIFIDCCYQQQQYLLISGSVRLRNRNRRRIHRRRNCRIRNRSHLRHSSFLPIPEFLR